MSNSQYVIVWFGATIALGIVLIILDSVASRWRWAFACVASIAVSCLTSYIAHAVG
jgi:hypothetical protein